jgi:opacity protein-like surface antigen
MQGKRMKRFLLISIVLLLGAISAQAADIYKTSKGAVFTKMQGPGQFGLGWKDPSGMLWGSDQGEFANVAIKPDQNGRIIDSMATEACARIGAMLPTENDYTRLISYFEKGQEPYTFSDKGLSDFNALFPDNRSEYGYWTSSVYVDSDTVGTFVVGSNMWGPNFVSAGGTPTQYRTTVSPVRCVTQ